MCLGDGNEKAEGGGKMGGGGGEFELLEEGGWIMMKYTALPLHLVFFPTSSACKYVSREASEPDVEISAWNRR